MDEVKEWTHIIQRDVRGDLLGGKAALAMSINVQPVGK